MYTLVDNQDSFVVISKHPGIDFHKGSRQRGLVETLRNDLKCQDLYPVHRLDTLTSGLLLFAKTRESARELAAQFRNHTIDKYYLALSDREPKKKQGLIRGDMKRGRRGAWILSKTTVNPAVSQFFSAGIGNGLRLFLIRPRTGRTHQIRVALKALGAPVVGDPLYGRAPRAGIGADRGYLHAFAIGFTIGGKVYRYRAMPVQGDYFTNDRCVLTIKKFEDPWSLPWPKLHK